MSILIACKRGDVVYMGTDTQVIVSDTKRTDTCQCNYKIQKVESGMLVGVTGGQEIRQTIFANSDIFTRDKQGKLTHRHIIMDILPKLLSVLDRADLIVRDRDDVPHIEAEIMLAYGGELFEICQWLSVLRYEDYQVVGECNRRAQYTIANIGTGDDVNQKIVQALDVVAASSSRVGKPYLLIDTKEQQYKLVGGKV